MCVRVRVKEIKTQMASEASRGFFAPQARKILGFCLYKGKFDDFDAGRDPGCFVTTILVTKHLSLKHCVHCNAAALAWDHAVSELCKAGRQGLIKPITWLESLLMGPIKHAPNGCQSQGVDMYSFIHDMRLPWRCRCGPVRTTTKPQLTYPKMSCS